MRQGAPARGASCASGRGEMPGALVVGNMFRTPTTAIRPVSGSRHARARSCPTAAAVDADPRAAQRGAPPACPWSGCGASQPSPHRRQVEAGARRRSRRGDRRCGELGASRAGLHHSSRRRHRCGEELGRRRERDREGPCLVGAAEPASRDVPIGEAADCRAETANLGAVGEAQIPAVRRLPSPTLLSMTEPMGMFSGPIWQVPTAFASW